MIRSAGMATLAHDTLGRYRLVERIGTGGMAEIYLARRADGSDVEPLCVVKRMLPELVGDPEMVELFVDEARLNLRLDHPNIAAVFDVARDGDELFLAMEYVGGRDLRWVLSALQRAGRRVPPELALYVAGELLRALGHVHLARDERGRPLELVHRDVSPENVLIGRDGRIKLTDFGAARSRISRSRLGQVSLVGKIGYLAPECLEGRPATAAVDLFATGLLLFEMLTGTPLHAATSAQAAWGFWSEFEPTAVIPARVPLAEGGAILVKALEPDPRRRYATAEAFLQDVEDQLFRRGRVAGGHLFGAFLEELEGSDDEQGRVTTAPVELPAIDSGARPAPDAGSEEETVEAAESEARPAYLLAAGAPLGPLGETTARLRAEEAGLEGALACRGRRYWLPAHEAFGLPAPVGAAARRIRCVELGPALLRAAACGGTAQVHWWLQQRLVSVRIEAGAIVQAVHWLPSAGPAVVLHLGAGPRGRNAECASGLLDASQRVELRRRELRRLLAVPMRWDELWTLTTTAGAVEPAAGAGVSALVALADAARAIPDEPRVADQVSRAARGGLAAHPQRRGLSRAAGLWRGERELLERIGDGDQLPDLLRRHQTGARQVFRALFVLLQTGLVSPGRAGGPS